jgi:Leucine Rich Repeat (LRR) protein
MNRIVPLLGLIASFIACIEGFGQSAGKVSFSPADQVVSPQERQALLALYEATDGNHWKDHTGWLGPAGTECVWYGVSCDHRGTGRRRYMPSSLLRIT